MLIRIIVTILLIYSLQSCHSQQNKIGNYISSNQEKANNELVEESILKARKLYKSYTGKAPKTIDLKFPDSIQELTNDEITVLKKYPEAYILKPRELLTKADTTRIVDAFLEKSTDNMIIQFDSSGKVLGYIEGFTIIPMNPDAKNKVGKDKKKKVKKYGNKMINEASKEEIKKVAFYDFHKNNKAINKDELYKYFLWCNFFYDYFDFNQPSPSFGIPKWLIDFSIIDAAMIDTIKIDSSINARLKGKLKKSNSIVYTTIKSFESNKNEINLKFIKIKYEVEWQSQNNKTSLLVPKRDDYWSGKWKYIELDISRDLEESNDTFLKMSLFVQFLKTQYGYDVIKNMVKWYLDNDYNTMLFATFINESYDKKTNINELKADFNNWIEENIDESN